MVAENMMNSSEANINDKDVTLLTTCGQYNFSFLTRIDAYPSPCLFNGSNQFSVRCRCPVGSASLGINKLSSRDSILVFWSEVGITGFVAL